MAQTMNTKRVTLADISRQTGYSVNTVSRALRDMSDIAPQTREQIRQVAREMGYTVNRVASSLRSGRTHVLALILGGMSNPFYGVMADMLQDAARSAGYSLMIMCSREDGELERSLVEQAIAQCADGVLLFPTGQSDPSIQRLRAADMPFVLMSRYLEAGAADCVVADEAQGAYLAARHLIEAGGRRPAFISKNEVLYSGRQRILGFERACDEAGIPVGCRQVRILSRGGGSPDPLASRGDGSPDSFEMSNRPHAALPRTLLELKAAGFDSLFSFCDVEAWHIMDALAKTDGLAPGDFRIASFDNLEGTLSFPIPLCSVDCDYAEMARRGVGLLRARIHGDDRPPQTITCPTRLVCRGSCGRD